MSPGDKTKQRGFMEVLEAQLLGEVVQVCGLKIDPTTGLWSDEPSGEWRDIQQPMYRWNLGGPYVFRVKPAAKVLETFMWRFFDEALTEQNVGLLWLAMLGKIISRAEFCTRVWSF